MTKSSFQMIHVVYSYAAELETSKVFFFLKSGFVKLLVEGEIFIALWSHHVELALMFFHLKSI